MPNRKLEIGPGDRKLGDEWECLDCVKNPNAEHFALWGKDPLPFDNQEFELVYASHVLEHIPWFKTVDALREVKRILKSGGKFEVWVPDFAKIVQSYLNNHCGDDWRKHNDQDESILWVNGRIFTYGPWPNWHHAVFDENHLRNCLWKAGFKSIVLNTERPRGFDHGPINLGLIAEV